jgi:hypothetical protein
MELERIRESLRRQFGAAVETLQKAIEACPEGVWFDRSRQPEFWYVAFHTLFFLDFYLAESPEGYQPPLPFTRDELDPAGILPEQPYSKAELLAFLDHSRNRLQAIWDAPVEKLQEQRKFRPIQSSLLEVLLYNMRHIQHHAAQLNLILRQATDSAPRWVRAAD